METAARTTNMITSSKIAVRNRFRRYRDEAKKDIRTTVSRKNAFLEQMETAWGLFNVSHYGTTTGYEKLLEILRGNYYSAEDIESFSVVLIELQEKFQEFHFAQKAGLFLSALVNLGTSNSNIIQTNHLEKCIDHLGFRNIKKMIVRGSVGMFLGEEMQGGTIIVEGDTGNGIGIGMLGGTIIINGNAGHNIGTAMQGGRIIIEGNVMAHVGDRSTGGETHINGEKFKLGHNVGAAVYHKGKQVK